jgi:hypothetical protein
VSERTFFQRIADRLALASHGGVRIRIVRSGGRLQGLVWGRTPGLPPQRILQEVLEIGPAGPGTIDLVHEERGSWTIRTSGELADPRFEQRLRNVLGNA